jgi:hypothetical protein
MPISLRTALLLLCMLVAMASCRDTPPDSSGGLPPCTSPRKITAIYKDFVYDLSGYENSGGGGPFNLFDENNFFDPKNGITGFPQTSPHPIRNPDIYFPPGRGSRIVVDLRVPYKLSEVFVYDRAAVPDTLWIYTGTPSNWKLKATLVTRGDVMAWGWKRLELDDSTQFIQFRFNSYEANIAEAVLYGCPLQPEPPAPTGGYTGQRLPKKPLKEFLGVNMYNELPLEWMEPFTWVRMYAVANLFDADTVNAYPNNKINISRLGYLYQGNSFRHYSDDLATVNKKMWYSVRGVPVWMEKKGFWDKDRPVTIPGMDPEDPMSYARHAYMMWTLAAVFGKTPVDTNLLNIGDMIRVSGKGTMTLFENGNEEDAWWVGNKYCTPMEYFAQSSADYDGHGGKMGSRHGIRTADSNSQMIMSGTVGLDTNRLKVLDFLCRNLRRDKKFLWEGGIQYHHYSNDVKTSIAPNRWQAAKRGITPEEDSLRQRLAKVRDFTYRLQPGVECILGEYGWDKSQLTTQSTPIIPGYSAAESQGIMLVRSINLVAFSGFDKLMIYWMKDHEPEQSPHIYLTSGLVFQSMDGKITPYPSWFHVSTMMHHLGDYIPDQIISEQGNVWVYKYRHRLQRDSVGYFVYAPSRTGKKISGYSLPVVGGSSTALEVSFADKLKAGKTAVLPVNNGRLVMEVTEVPKLILYKE